MEQKKTGSGISMEGKAGLNNFSNDESETESEALSSSEAAAAVAYVSTFGLLLPATSVDTLNTPFALLLSFITLSLISLA